MLKLDVAFLYDLLGASQEQSIKPKKFAQTDIDEVILGHTNEPEFRKLQNNEFMEALRDRTVKIDVPYISRLENEVKIYKRDFSADKIPHVHIAPHTLEMAATWSVLTRLEEPKKSDLTLLQKLKLYNGKTLPGYNEDNVKELRKESIREGLDGISPRYIQDKISNSLVKYGHIGCLNPFMVFNELESGLKHHSLVKSHEQLDHYKELLAIARQEYEDTVKNDLLIRNRATIMREFSEKVILVEGLAEKLLIPCFAEKEGIDLLDNHISIVEVGGINFDYFLPIFKDSKKKILCIRDCDFKYLIPAEKEGEKVDTEEPETETGEKKGNAGDSGDEKKKEELKLDISKYDTHIKSLELIHSEYKAQTNCIYVKTQRNLGSTFENELFLDNFTDEEKDIGKDTVCKQLLKLVLPAAILETDLIKKLSIEYWADSLSLINNQNSRKKIEKDINLYVNSFNNTEKQDGKDKIERLFFANLFLSYASNQKGNLALEILMSDFKGTLEAPEYIKDGLKWIK